MTPGSGDSRKPMLTPVATEGQTMVQDGHKAA